jgi:DNA-binding NarL/FixJ family response regulator
MTGPVRVLLVDDHPAVRQGLRLVLEHQGMAVCGEAAGPERALALAAQADAQLVIVDLSLGQENGLHLLADLTRRHPRLQTLVYSMHEDPGHIRRALRAGARGYQGKGEAIELLVQGLREVLAGRIYLSPRIAQALARAEASGSESLSRKEQDIYGLLGQGLPTAAIAARLDLSPRTVETYFARMQAKLRLAGTRELRQQAIAERTQG